MIRYALTRLALLLLGLFVASALIFLTLRILPGDVAQLIAGVGSTPEQIDAIRERLGLGTPLPVQYVTWISGVLRGDLGTSLLTGAPVATELAQKAQVTVPLGILSLTFALLIALPLGVLSAMRRGRPDGTALSVGAQTLAAVPVVWAGMMLVLVFAVWLGWLPVSGRASVRTEIALNREGGTGIYLIDAIASGNPAYIQDVLSHAVLPALTLGLLTAGIFLRLVRTNVIGTFNMPYIDAARSRGVREGRLVRTHAYKPALIPIITVIGLQVALMLGGAVLTETTFEWKGLGFQLAAYLSSRDFVAVQGIVAMIAIIVALTNFAVDIIAAFIDPRVRY